MNDKQKEQAAKKLCELRGIDPYSEVTHGVDPDENGIVLDVLLYSPAWTRALREIESADQINIAMGLFHIRDEE